MKITTARIKEIIREELSRVSEGTRTPYEDANTVTVPGVGPEGLRRSLDDGGGMELEDDEVKAAFAAALGEEPGGVYEMGPGAGFQALVEFDDGRLVKVKLAGGFTGDPDPEDVDAEIDLQRMNKPMGVRLK